ncbi:DUF3099 domain-containing protein [uncultured Serinicoccus sp.]|uniref:DUF3099 domain-containing protein n=1 Tax=uncultured Serinicoccus sp. TaxID=735514 RepID=UPI002606E365|nr:DUF3099 domain-containing protein [uncultured Serinicoccus sp.]
MPTSSAPRAGARRPAQGVTSARRSVEEDRKRRMWQYLTAMGIRTVSFPVAVWAFTTQRYALAWVAVFLAVVIPAFAVMVANAVDQRRGPASAPQAPTRGLGTGPAPDPGAADRARSGAVITGTVVSDRHTPRGPDAS